MLSSQHRQHHAAAPLNAGHDLDEESLRLIALLLEEELEEERNARAAEDLQLELSLAESRPPSPRLSAARLPNFIAQPQTDDLAFSLRSQLDSIHSTLSVRAMPQIAKNDHEQAADHLRAQDLARRLEQETRTEATDALYARALQAIDDAGREDIDEKKTAEEVLGEEKIREMSVRFFFFSLLGGWR
jgi:hypothetical protein